MPSRIFFTSASVAAKMPWIFAVTSARFASSLDLVLPLSATSFASAAPLAALHAGDARRRSPRAASALPCSMTCCSCWRNSAGRGVGVRGRGLLVGEALLELGLVGLRQLLLADLAVGHLLVGLRACRPRG